MSRQEAATLSSVKKTLWRGFSRVVAIRWVSWIALHLATVIDRPLMRMSGGRWRLSFIIPCVLIECRGVRTGLTRRVPLLCVPDGEDLLVVGSNGGAIGEPAWCVNLRAEAEITGHYGGKVKRLLARELGGEERAIGWRLAVDVYPGYDRYQSRVRRQIAVFRLMPRS